MLLLCVNHILLKYSVFFITKLDALTLLILLKYLPFLLFLQNLISLTPDAPCHLKGITTITFVPTLISLSTVILPPCKSIAFLTIDNPNPVPETVLTLLPL